MRVPAFSGLVGFVLRLEVSLRAVIPPHYLELVADAALKSYWRKRALSFFLRRCGVSESFLATWHEDESKRDLLYRLFRS